MGIYFESLVTDLAAVFVTIACIIVAYFKYSFTYWSRRGVPTLPPSIPFGNFGPQLLQRVSFGELCVEIYKKLKAPGRSFAGMYMFGKPVLLLLDPELVKSVLVKDFHYFQDRGGSYDEENDPLSGHLVNLSGVKWRNLRTKLTPTFSSGKLKIMFETLVACSDSLEDILDEYVKKSEAIDIKDIVGRFTTDIIGSCAFGLQCNSLQNPDAEFRKYGKKVFEKTSIDTIRMAMSIHFPKLFNFLGLKRTSTEVNNFFMEVVRDTVEYRERNNVIRKDFMQLLINLKNNIDLEDEKENLEPGKHLTMNELTAQAFVFFLAGFETSSTAMTFFFYDMATHQDIQDKVRNEINEVLKKYDGKFTYDAIMEMHYLDKAVNESMRLHGGIPTVQRRCTQDYRIPGSDVTVKKGIMVFIPALGMQTDPEYYPEPEKYDPERFSPEEKAKRHPFTFLPFGEGPRNCIGLRFGLMQTKVGIAVLLKNHRFTLNSKTTTPLAMDPKNFILCVKGGVWLNAERI